MLLVPLPPVVLTLAVAIRAARRRLGLSQRQLAARIQPTVPRTYVSKLENEKAMPTLSSLARLASASRYRCQSFSAARSHLSATGSRR